MPCPYCESANTKNAISFGMPLQFCTDCEAVWGGVFGILYAIISPLELLFCGHNYLMAYEDCFFSASFHYWFNNQE